MQIKKATSKVALLMPLYLGPGYGLDHSRRDFNKQFTLNRKSHKQLARRIILLIPLYIRIVSISQSLILLTEAFQWYSALPSYVALTHPNPPPRPDNVTYTSIRELYLHFESIFLAGTKSLVVSPCDHKIHMAGVVVEGIKELSMPRERDTILKSTDGFAHYELRERGSRAKHLKSARETLENPDEV